MSKLSKKQRRKRRNRAQQRVSSNKGNTKTVSRTIPAGISQSITTSGGLKRLVLTHKEYVQDINYDGDHGLSNISQLDINPGLELRFPWLSGLARQFETYYFTKLHYCYVPAVGTTEDGAIAMAPDYDAADDNRSMTKSQLFAFEDAKRGPLWAPMVMKCSPKNLRKMRHYYVRQKHLGSASNLDIKTYDTLSLNIMVSHAPEEKNLGELWVEYSIVLETPQLEAEAEVDVITTSESIWPASPTPYENGIENTGSYPVATISQDPHQLSFGKAGYYTYLWKSFLQTADPTPSVGFPEFQGGYGIDNHLLNAAFNAIGPSLYEATMSGIVYFPRNIEDILYDKVGTWYNPGYTNVTSGHEAGKITLVETTKALFDSYSAESIKVSPGKLGFVKPGFYVSGDGQKRLQDLARKKRLKDLTNVKGLSVKQSSKEESQGFIYTGD